MVIYHLSFVNILLSLVNYKIKPGTFVPGLESKKQ